MAGVCVPPPPVDPDCPPSANDQKGCCIASSNRCGIDATVFGADCYELAGSPFASPMNPARTCDGVLIEEDDGGVEDGDGGLDLPDAGSGGAGGMAGSSGTGGGGGSAGTGGTGGSGGSAGAGSGGAGGSAGRGAGGRGAGRGLVGGRGALPFPGRG
jgi:hypothetical protein